jgi:serine phosphatase RsbU (regulator of sigma subunit)/anti-sigma regulatory factor (Ser/Thr protein kinase)
MSRRIASSVTGLTLPARDLIDGNPLRAPKVYFQEANEVSIAMADAAQKLGLRTTEAQIAFQNLQASEKSLTEANLTLESRVKERTQVLEELMQEREALGEAVQSQFDELKQANDLLKALRRRELEVGAIIQRSLVIEVPEGIEGAWLAQYADPSQIVDGDFCSIRRFGSNCFEVLVGDVMGKGIQAALMGTGIMTAYNRSLVDLLVANKNGQAIPSPADIVNAIHRSMTPQLMAISSFATLALYRFDLDAGTLTYVNAGHTHGLLTRGPGARPVAILGDNLPIGVMPEENYVELNLAVGPDDSLLIFSDGITEARNPQGEEFGLERLSDLIEAGSKANLLPTTIVQALRGAQRRFIGGGPGADDLTAVMVCLRPRRSGLVRSVEDRIAPLVFSLPWNLEGLGGLRDQIMACAGNLAQDDTDALILASFEAATNIIRHARLLVGDATITCRITRESDALAVEMVYPSESFTAPTQVNPDMSGESEGGFGLYIIEQSVDSVEYASPMPGVASVRVVKRAGVVQPAPTEPAI